MAVATVFLKNVRTKEAVPAAISDILNCKGLGIWRDWRRLLWDYLLFFDSENDIFLISLHELTPATPISSHRSGSGSKVNFGYQRKFQLDMNFWGKSYQKMHNLKISTGGPSLVILGFLAVFGKNRVKNAFYGNLALYFNCIYIIWSKYHFSPKYLISIGK